MNQQQPQWVRKPVAIPEHVRYAHSLRRGALTFEQVDELVKAINPAYVQAKQSKSYLAQHQARAEMNRIFGYGNWSSRVLDMRLAYEERLLASDQPRHPSFPKNGKADVYWISAYEAHVQVEVRDLWGMPVTDFDEWHAEENAPQPNRGEARALAMTSVESYALRRALIGLGDRLGLGLYAGGSTAPHGQYTIQQQPGVLYQWVDLSTLQPVAVQPAVTHETVQARLGVDDEGTMAETQQVQQAPQPQSQLSPEQARQQFVSPEVQHFGQVAQQMQQDRSAMMARVQQGFKVDGAQG